MNKVGNTLIPSRVILTLFFVLLSGCATHTPVTLKPIKGMSVVLDSSFDTLDFSDNEVLIFNEDQLLGRIKRVHNEDKSITSIESLKTGFTEARKGSRKPELLDIKDGLFGFVVHTDNFSTIFLASEKEESVWSEISVRRADFDTVIQSLK